MSARILYVAYPLLPVSAESCGGAEQVLLTLEAEINRRGHQTAVATANGSSVAGQLVATGVARKDVDHFEDRLAEHVTAIIEYSRQHELALIHDHSGWFWPYARKVAAPVLATLHLPRTFYDAVALATASANVRFNCVSETQAKSFRELGIHPAVIENGIDLEHFRPTRRKSEYLLWLGRICEEKAPHVAIAAARASGTPLIIAGEVYPFSYHQQYFEREIAPHIDGERVKFIPRPNARRKLRLLQKALAVLVPSTVPETSSLVAMEAVACGTPVIASRAGALPRIVAHGATGFVTDTVEQMAEAISQLPSINRSLCRREAELRFSAQRMCDAYERLYGEILREVTLQTAAA